ncbi:hypothetical protein SLS62_003816 [Diatrype stigma]|uniref:Uncharacterized protein n=1 Tax=Diatrype stigma TaxID=117547 RepID=A0AAN9V654_9PEZI
MGSYRLYRHQYDCEFPRFPNRRWGGAIWFVVILLFGIFFLAAAGGVITNVVLTVKFINTDNTGFEPENPDFPSFKNSRFEECASLVPDPANCTAILDILNHTSYPVDQDYLSHGYIPISSQWRGENGSYYDWCTAASCFHGYEVLPSTARPEVIGLTNFEIWANVNVVTLIFFFNFMKRNWALFKSDDHICRRNLREIGLINGFILLYSIGASIVWWWIKYAQFAKDPVPNTTMSIYAWTTTWLLASNIHYHPYSCIFDRRRPGLRRTLSWLLSFLAVAQWGATVHILAVGWRYVLQKSDISQGYDCSAAMITETSPGIARCSAERLCSDEFLLSNMQFSWGFEEHLIVTVGVVFFVLLSMVALQPFVWASWRELFRGADSWSEQFKRCDIGPIAGPALTGLLATLYAGFAAIVSVKLLTLVDREAPLVADQRCNVVHVGISTWRYYLDLNLDGGRAIRIAKSWFNA